VFYGLAFLVSLALLAFCVLDCIATDSSMVRNLPKTFWIMVIIFIPTIGSVAWLLLGRPENTRFSPGDTRYRPTPPPAPARPKRPLGPEDDPRFQEITRNLIPPAVAPPKQAKVEAAPELPVESAGGEHGVNDLKAWEEDLVRREEELRRRLEGDKPGD
jgi:transglutaminase-like putative cysteine protease